MLVKLLNGAKKFAILTTLGVNILHSKPDDIIIQQPPTEQDVDNENVRDYLNMLNAGIETIFNSYDNKYYEIDYQNENTNDAEITESKIDEKQLTLEDLIILNNERIEVIKKIYDLTDEEFNIFACVMIKEAKPYDNSIDNYKDCYEDCYHTTSVFYNRTQSISFRTYIDKINYDGAGSNLYGQVTAKNQSTVYQKGYYKELLDVDKTGDPRYQAVIDMLFSGAPSNDYLSFRSNCSEPEDKIQLVPGGNRFLLNSILTDDDRYVEEESEDMTLKLTQ